MGIDFISLAVIALVAAVAPIIAAAIPGKLVPETVLLLIAGAVLGPYALSVVNVSAEIDLLSELGMAFLFLLAGYEINPKSISGKQGRKAALTWLISFGLAICLLMFAFGDRLDSIGALAVAIALTTTAIGTLMPILSERGIMGTRIGDLVLSYGTYGELLPVLAIALLLSARAKWVTAVVLLIFAAIAVFAALRGKAFAKAGNRVFDFLVDRADSNSQTLVRVTVFLLISLVALSAIFKLDIILGAFAAGFVLRFIVPEGNHSLEQKLEAIGYGFLIPLFFVVSGAGIDLTAIMEAPLVLVAFILMLIGVRFVPILVSLSIGKETRDMRWFDRISVAFYCTTALPLIVAVTNIAVSSGSLSQSMASIMVAAGAVTVFLMPLLATVCQSVAGASPLKAVEELREAPGRSKEIISEHAKRSHEAARAERARRREAVAEHRRRRHERMRSGKGLGTRIDADEIMGAGEGEEGQD